MNTRRHLPAWMLTFASLAIVSAALAEPATGTPASETPAAPAAPPAVASPTSGLRVTLDLPDASVREVLDAITDQTGLSLVLTNPEAADLHQVALKVKDMPVDDLLPTLAEQAGLTIEHRGNALIVTGGAVTKHHGHVRAMHKIEHLPGPGRSITIDTGHDGGKSTEGNIHIDIDADERVSMGSDGLVDAGQTVSEATVIGGSLKVKGHVEGDAVAIGGWVTLEPGAIVDGDVVAVAGSISAPSGVVITGDAVSVGGMVRTEPGTVIGGDRVQVGGRIGGVVLGLIGLAGGAPLAFRVAMCLLRVALLLGAGVLLVTYAPRRLDNVRAFLLRRPGLSALGGLGLVVGVLPLCFVLMLTLVGIPLIPLVVSAFGLLYLVGVTVLAGWLGDRLPVLAGRKSQVTAVLLGLIVITVVKAVPFLGSLVVLLAATAAAGAALLSRVGQPPAIPPAIPPAAPAPTEIPTTPSSI